LKRSFVKFLSGESGATNIEHGLIAAGIALAIIAAVNGLLEPSRIADHCHNLAPSLNSFRGVLPMLVRLLITLWRSPGKARVNPSSLSHLRRDRETDHLQDGMRGLFVKETMSKS
jgi:pilus assembly protein Flp/PilA